MAREGCADLSEWREMGVRGQDLPRETARCRLAHGIPPSVEVCGIRIWG